MLAITVGFLAQVVCIQVLTCILQVVLPSIIVTKEANHYMDMYIKGQRDPE